MEGNRSEKIGLENFACRQMDQNLQSGQGRTFGSVDDGHAFTVHRPPNRRAPSPENAEALCFLLKIRQAVMFKDKPRTRAGRSDLPRLGRQFPSGPIPAAIGYRGPLQECATRSRPWSDRPRKAQRLCRTNRPGAPGAPTPERSSFPGPCAAPGSGAESAKLQKCRQGTDRFFLRNRPASQRGALISGP
jgi:hypothetical protein